MDLENTLKGIGLDYKEIKVYLAVLELGQSTVTPISKKSSFKRTYCYDILEDLKKKKLVDYIEKNGRRHYFAEDPKEIGEQLEKKLTDFQVLLPELRSIYNQPAVKPKVRYFEGQEGIIEIYKDAQNTKVLLAIGSINSIYESIGQIFDEHIDKLVKNEVNVCELLAHEGKSPEYLKRYTYPLQEARYLPKNVKISTDMMLFDNKLAMISYDEEMHAVVIESSSIVNTMKTIFELLWNIADNYSIDIPDDGC